MKEDVTIPRRAEIINSELNPTWEVLDIGARDGYLTNRITNVKKIIGLDIDEKEIEKAKKSATDITYIVGDASNLPFPSNRFDAVIAGDIIEHLADGDRMLKEAYRVLKSGGKLLISCPYHGILKGITISMLNFDEHFDTQGGHLRFYTINSLTNALERNGFRITKKYFIGRLPYIWRSMMFVGVK